tara:strand:- start:9793 stop:14220 length:4428 start_codon:yes stop_codon:yes gene_type:complete
MQRKFQHTFTKSKMNKDLDARLLAPDEYRDGNNIAVSRAEADDVGALENILGNTIISALNNTSVFLEQVVGWHINEDKDKIYIFSTDFQDNTPNQQGLFCPLETKNLITVVNTVSNTTRTIASGRYLNFSWSNPILDTVMLEDLLFWTDDRNQPRVINVITAESNPSYYFNEDHVSLAKYYPHKTIKLNQEYQINGALVNKDSLFTDNGLFRGLYNFILLPASASTTPLIQALLGVNATSTTDQGQVNFGLQGYALRAPSSGGAIVNFKVAFVQRDDASDLPGVFTNGYIIAIDRDLSSLITAQEGSSYTATTSFTFIDQSSKDVTSPWLKEDQVKITTKSVSSTLLTYTASSVFNDFPTALYQYGTRSPGLMGAGQSTYQSEVFAFPNHFPKNTTTATKKGYCRITHPKLDPNKYYVVTGVNIISSSSLTFSISQLTNLINGSLTAVDPSSILSAGDILSINWPNKYYNQNFIGDEAFLEDKFVRFAYRFTYEDGQNSLISPFTQAVFIPKQRGNFLKKIDRVNSNGNNTNNFVPDEKKSGETTIVESMENKVNQIKLVIPCEYVWNTIQNNLKVRSIDILYKESTQQTIRVVDTIPVTEGSITGNTTKLLEYVYNSKEPIKTLRSAETTRVYDNIPTRAKTLSSAGNRIILGNFYDRPSSPNSLSYFVGSGRKFTPGETPATPSNSPSNLANTFSTVSYPNHSLKQNRSYQVGIILQDRYGRSSDVVLSSVTDDNFTLDTGVFAINPIDFSGSTMFHSYLESVLTPLTAQASITTSAVTRAGIVDWPGDSLKLLFANVVPREIPTLPGYPGLYADPFTSTVVIAQSFDNVSVSKGGNNDNIQPGTQITWTEGGIEYNDLYVLMTVTSASALTLITRNINGEAAANFPSVGVSVDFILSSNPLGFSSYKVVVKQLQQEYYNVYLPSLLDGVPVIKPFTQQASFTSGSKTVTMFAITGVEYLTFALLEGMKVVTSGGNVYFINNILNYTQFEISQAATATEADNVSTFSTEASLGILNVTTLLTDNANKVPPALEETSPVQQNFSTSDVGLIPRYAFSQNWTVTSGDPYNTTNTGAISIFPNKQTLKVQSIGNFEDIYSRGSYNGLYQADTDPPTGVIQNTFNIGQASPTSKPASEAETIAAAYETTPVISNLEIFYETSTAGSIKDLNSLIRANLLVPGYFVTWVSGTNTGINKINEVLVSESLDYSSTPTVATIQLVDQNGTLIKYYDSTPSLIKMKNITISNPQYSDGSKILSSGIVFEKAASTDAANRFFIKLNSDFIGFNSGPNGNTNQIFFNVEFDYNSVGDVFNKASIPIALSVGNVAPQPQNNFLVDNGTVYYLDNIEPTIDPTPKNEQGAGISWNNNNSANSTETTATNGGNVNNTKQNANKNNLEFRLEVKTASLGSEYVDAKNVEGLGLYLLENESGTVKLATTGDSKFTQANLDIKVVATDGDGQGESTTISSSIVRFNSSAS